MQVRSTNPPTVSHTPPVSGTPAPQTVVKGAAAPVVSTIEQRVAMLEAMVRQLASVLTVSPCGNVAKLHANTLEVEGVVALNLKGGVNTVIESGVQLKMKANGPTKINGSPLELNDGRKAVARTDDILRALESRVVVGNPTVLA